jgi:hypothetical protein
MKSSVRIEESKNTKFSNLLQLLLRKITAAVTRIEKTEGSNHYEKKISLATIAAGSLLLNFDNCTAGVKRVARRWQR